MSWNDFVANKSPNNITYLIKRLHYQDITASVSGATI
jgi:hypothetical protein